jgi:SAM-dependent methyltransferase
MSHNAFLNAQVLSLLPENLGEKAIFDAGCGFGEWGFLIRTRKSGHPHLVGLDIWRPHLSKLHKLQIYDEFVYGQIPPIPFRSKSVDISLACEILEHLPREIGLKLLADLERVTKELVIVSTPIDYPQSEIYDNPRERHVSNWSLRDFAQRNYETRLVYTLPKTLLIVDRIRRLIFRLSPPLRFIIATKSS